MSTTAPIQKTFLCSSAICKLGVWYTIDMVDKIYATEKLPDTIITKHEFKAIISEMLNTVSFDYLEWDSYIKDAYINRVKI